MAPVATSRRGLLGGMAVAPALIALPAGASTPDRSAWDRAYHRYQLAAALFDAANEFGYTKDADNAFDMAVYHAGYTPENWQKAPAPVLAELQRLFDKSNKASDEAYERFFEPADKAAVTLMCTPAPDIEAIHFKVALVKKHELDNYSPMPKHPMDILIEDARRLGEA